MTGDSVRGRLARGNLLRSAIATALTCMLAVGLLVLAPGVTKTSKAAAEELTQCGGTVTAPPTVTRQINLVLDESGSMFYEGSPRTPIDRWSFAKYSLEVFAALMGPNDTLDVYRMSDFDERQGGSATASPALDLSGASPADSRVREVHDMPLLGKGTPYATVQTALADLETSSAGEKWLVVLTDGEFFQGSVQVPASRVESDLIAATDDDIRIAFMSIGPQAPTLESKEGKGLFVIDAPDTNRLLKGMTEFANRIFQRAVVSLRSPYAWTNDIPMDEVVLFAQGASVRVGPASAPNGIREPKSPVEVKWVENAPIPVSGGPAIEAKPNRSLEGQLATFSDLAVGTVTFDVANAKTVDLFYKPRVNFGVNLLDPDGNAVGSDQKFAGQQYTLEYGFMDENCSVIESPLLGNVEYSADLIRDGVTVESDLKPGSTITLPEGDVTLNVSATYLDGITASSVLQVTGSSAQPESPMNVSASPGNSSALVSWEESAYSGSAPIERYVVTSDPGGITCEAIAQTSCQVEGLMNGTSYTFTVEALNGAGEKSPVSGPSNPVTPFAGSSRDYIVSEMQEFPPPADGLRFGYVIVEGDQERAPTVAQWRDLDPASIIIETDANLDLSIIKGEQPGDLTLLPRAPNGDVYSASTGPITVTLSLPEELNPTGSPAVIDFTVIDDISSADRWRHWFLTTGLRLLIGLLLLVLVAGYLMKKRFPKKIKESPSIEGSPRVLGQQRLQGRGRFEVNGLRRILPFVADTATLTYVPLGAVGFGSMKLKAGPRKMLRLTNWRDIAKQGNVQINGGLLDESTVKEPIFNASSMITADTPQMTYEMILNQ